MSVTISAFASSTSRTFGRHDPLARGDAAAGSDRSDRALEGAQHGTARAIKVSARAAVNRGAVVAIVEAEGPPTADRRCRQPSERARRPRGRRRGRRRHHAMQSPARPQARRGRSWPVRGAGRIADDTFVQRMRRLTVRTADPMRRPRFDRAIREETRRTPVKRCTVALLTLITLLDADRAAGSGPPGAEAANADRTPTTTTPTTDHHTDDHHEPDGPTITVPTHSAIDPIDKPTVDEPDRQCAATAARSSSTPRPAPATRCCWCCWSP